MLNDNGGISHERPEIIRPNPRVTLKVIEEGLGIGVVIRI